MGRPPVYRAYPPPPPSRTTQDGDTPELSDRATTGSTTSQEDQSALEDALFYDPPPGPNFDSHIIHLATSQPSESGYSLINTSAFLHKHPFSSSPDGRLRWRHVITIDTKLIPEWFDVQVCARCSCNLLPMLTYRPSSVYSSSMITTRKTIYGHLPYTLDGTVIQDTGPAIGGRAGSLCNGNRST